MSLATGAKDRAEEIILKELYTLDMNIKYTISFYDKPGSVYYLSINCSTKNIRFDSALLIYIQHFGSNTLEPMLSHELAHCRLKDSNFPSHRELEFKADEIGFTIWCKIKNWDTPEGRKNHIMEFIQFLKNIDVESDMDHPSSKERIYRLTNR